MHPQSSLPTAGASPEDSAKRHQAAIALAEAMARARGRQAREEVARAESQTSHAARLEAIRHQLAPLYAAIPRDVELFDLGMVSNEKPRLFVDIIAFIEMNAEGASFRFVQETRSGKVVLLETDSEAALRQAVTDYIARRLIEREQALATSAYPNVALTEPAMQKPAGVEHLPKPDVPRITGDVSASAPRPALSSAPVLAPVPATVPAPVSALQQASVVAAGAAMPQTANQAFERWTSAKTLPDTVPDTSAPLLHLARKPGSVEQKDVAAEEELAAVRRELVGMTEKLETATDGPKPSVSLSSVEPATIKLAAVASNGKLTSTTEPQPSAVPVALTAAATATAVARSSYTPRQTANPGWWLWPMLAMMVGIGLGALLLYLYAANILRP